MNGVWHCAHLGPHCPRCAWLTALIATADLRDLGITPVERREPERMAS